MGPTWLPFLAHKQGRRNHGYYTFQNTWYSWSIERALATFDIKIEKCCEGFHVWAFEPSVTTTSTLRIILKKEELQLILKFGTTYLSSNWDHAYIQRSFGSNLWGGWIGDHPQE